jgi:hypothetical protein
MATQYDHYRELAGMRQGVWENNALVYEVGRVVDEVGRSLESIHNNIEMVRRTTSAALMVQQELLNRENLQSVLEEFTYQAEKMLDNFEVANDESTDPSTRYYILTGLLDSIKDSGISTAVIRGRDNKAAFDKVVDRGTELQQKLLSDKEVKQAIQWVENEKQRKAEEERRVVEQERQRKAEVYRKAAEELRQKAEEERRVVEQERRQRAEEQQRRAEQNAPRVKELTGYPITSVRRKMLPPQEVRGIHRRRSTPRCVSPTRPT